MNLRLLIPGTEAALLCITGPSLVRFHTCGSACDSLVFYGSEICSIFFAGLVTMSPFVISVIATSYFGACVDAALEFAFSLLVT